MLPCPEGKVPYSLQLCYNSGDEWPPVDWVENQIREGRIDYLGGAVEPVLWHIAFELSAISLLSVGAEISFAYWYSYRRCGPNHGSPDFKIEMGNPRLLKKMLSDFPNLKLWIMHSGDQYYKETIEIMMQHQQVYADISVISNPEIVPFNSFSTIMKSFMDSGLEDRLMFGTDNGNIVKVINSVESLVFLAPAQKSKLYYRNAERFFDTKN